jgi:hypothetical protein
MENYNLFKIALAVLATVGLYTVLYRENKFYRFWEHVFVGLASGWALVAIWTESLREAWWERMIGTPATAEGGAEMGYWLYAILLPVLSYFLFSFDVKNKILQRTTLTGRWLLMIGFGAIFGSTVMMRFTLLIDRMYFIWIEFVRDGLGRLFGG